MCVWCVCVAQLVACMMGVGHQPTNRMFPICWRGGEVSCLPVQFVCVVCESVSQFLASALGGRQAVGLTTSYACFREEVQNQRHLFIFLILILMSNVESANTWPLIINCFLNTLYLCRPTLQSLPRFLQDGFNNSVWMYM